MNDEHFLVMFKLGEHGEVGDEQARTPVDGGVKAVKRLRDLAIQTELQHVPLGTASMWSAASPAKLAELYDEFGSYAFRIGDFIIAMGDATFVDDRDALVELVAARSDQLDDFHSEISGPLAERLAYRSDRYGWYWNSGSAVALTDDEYAKRIELLSLAAGEEFALDIVDAAASDAQPPRPDVDVELSIQRWLVSPGVEPCPDGKQHQHELEQLLAAIYASSVGSTGLTLTGRAESGSWPTDSEFIVAVDEFMRTSKIRHSRCQACGQDVFRQDKARLRGVAMDLLLPELYPAPAIIAFVRHVCDAERGRLEWSAAEVEQQQTDWRRHEVFPSDVPAALLDRCLVASRMIRTERQMAYDRPIHLEAESEVLTLLPIVTRDSQLLMPFRNSRRDGLLSGALVLGDMLNGEVVIHDSDPLPLLIDSSLPQNDLVAVWARALIGYADATCFAIESANPRSRPTAAPNPNPRATASTKLSSARTAPRRRWWPSHFEPVGNWTRRGGALVAGHRRVLTSAQSASKDACDRARRVGIMLHANETWVRPHARGIGDDVDVRFRWREPDELVSMSND